MHRSIVLGVCGGSGSGKSTFSDHLARRIGSDRVTILALDAYYLDLAEMPVAEAGRINFDHPDAIDIDGFVADLDALRSGADVDTPVYDFETARRTGSTKTLATAEIIVAEGILALHFDAIVARLDTSVFLDVPAPVRLARRVSRDVVERGRIASDVEAVFTSVVEPMHHRFVEPSRDRADHVIGFEDDPGSVVDRLLDQVNDPVLAPA